MNYTFLMLLITTLIHTALYTMEHNTTKQTTDTDMQIMDDKEAEERIAQLITQLKLVPVYCGHPRYCILADPTNSLFKAKRNISLDENNFAGQNGLDKLMQLLKQPETPEIAAEKELIQKTLAQNYKIHLMPKKNTYFGILYRLLNALNQNNEFKNIIHQIKYRCDPYKTPYNDNLPYVVIYPGSGKEPAQKALDTIYQLFKSVDGTGITPRFNARVTSLIYAAQGEGAHKETKNNKYDQFFQETTKVYYSFPGDHDLRIPTDQTVDSQIKPVKK